MKKKPVVVFVLAVIALYALTNSLGLNEASLQFIASHAAQIEAFIQKSFLLSLFIYFCIYVFLLCLGLPMGAVLAMLSGFFYDLSTGVAITVVSACVAALITFFLGKSFLYGYLKRKYGKKVQKIERAVNENGAYYVLAVRVSSVLPFFWVNLLFGASNLSYRQYVLPTLAGLVPGTFVYANIGRSLASLDSLQNIFSFKIAFSFLLLGALALLPVIIKKMWPKYA